MTQAHGPRRRRLVALALPGLVWLAAAPGSLAQPVSPEAAPHGPAHPARRPVHARAPAGEKRAGAKPAASPAKTVTLAPAPPPPAEMAPLVTAPPRPVPPPPPVSVVSDALGQASPIEGGERISFGAGSSDLNPAMVEAIRAVAAELAGKPNSSVSLYAFSAGPADDPSTPRRLALARALAVRAVLISEGVASNRIYPRVQPPSTTAPGPPPADPTDRVDMVVSGAGQAAAPQASATAAPAKAP